MSDARVRPEVHFTAAHGWTNDPYGIHAAHGGYEMFFQYNPAGTEWSEKAQWGHAASDDLITWRELDVALTPLSDEIGCWSGSAVVDLDGSVAVYTRIADEDWGRGAVALARPTSVGGNWARVPARPVLDGPPDDLDIIAFRDPQLRRRGEAWVAVMGAGIRDRGGCALQYGVSADLTEWTFEGVLAERANSEREPIWTGKVWECPQFLLVDGQWVLLVSVWEDDVLHNVVYAIGDYDGQSFAPRAWGTFSHGPQLYATTTFTDSQGRPCAMSWMRERDNRSPAASPWCSAMSLPHVLSLSGDSLQVRHHPALDGYFIDQIVTRDLSAGDDITAGVPEGPWRFRADVGCVSEMVLEVRAPQGAVAWCLRADARQGLLIVTDGDGEVLARMTVVAGRGGALDAVVDADILEVTWSAGEGVVAVRVPMEESAMVHVKADGGAVNHVALMASTTSRTARGVIKAVDSSR